MEREYKTIIHNGIKYAIPNFVDNRTAVIQLLREDENGNLIFSYLGQEIRAIKIKSEYNGESSMWQTTIWGIPYWLWLPLVSIISTFIFIALGYALALQMN